MVLMGRTLRKCFLVPLFILLLVEGCTEEQVVDALLPTYYGYDKQFHVPGCSVIQNVSDSKLAKFTSRDAAIGAGFVACPVCKP